MLPAISTREILLNGSSAILAAAIKIDVECVKNLPRWFNSFIVVDKSAAIAAAGFVLDK